MRINLHGFIGTLEAATQTHFPPGAGARICAAVSASELKLIQSRLEKPDSRFRSSMVARLRSAVGSPPCASIK